MKVNMFYEYYFGRNVCGMHKAMLDDVKALRKKGVEVFVNSNEKCDIFHSHTIGPLCMTKLKKHRSRSIVNAHNTPENALGRRPFARVLCPIITKYIKTMYNAADLVIADSPMVERRLNELGIKPRIELMPGTVNRKLFKNDTEAGKSFRHKFKLDESDFIVLCVAQLQTSKGVEDFHKLAKRLPECKFVWVGPYPEPTYTEDYWRIRSLVRNQPDNLTFTGYLIQEKLIGAYSAADIFLFPSYTETFGIAIAEASSFGLPLLLRDLEVYEDIFSGNYLKASDLDKFIENIKKLRENKKLYSKYSRKSKNIAKLYSDEKRGDNLLKIYTTLLETN